ncbi:MAG: energy-coupling factor ABC transporter ATP-binding protein [Clostridia bacterium]|nr:energy-coupling factor ABC transporter ATP-binding protein [Clostridia bacterium]
MKSNMPLLQLSDVCFNYPHEDSVLMDITFSIGQGEKVCILGANGSGKSTLLKLLCGLVSPQKGEFKAFGTHVTVKSFSKDSFSKDFHRKIGFVFQNSDTQLFCSTVREEIAFGPLQMNIPYEEVNNRIADVLDLLDIQHLKEKTPFKLSGGEKKKVALASILVLNPLVLILDEPTNGLDPKTQRWLVELLTNLNRTGKTIITSTHNLELVQEISDRCIVFGEDHRLAADDSTEKVMADIDLLKRVNIVDEYYHRHGDGHHAHYHIHNY